ncbi:MAG: hypothetical protein ACW97Z_07525 [Candidatus Hodarchaeales archaeon]
MENSKDTIKCLSCRADIPSHAKFCTKCGTEIRLGQPASEHISPDPQETRQEEPQPQIPFVREKVDIIRNLWIFFRTHFSQIFIGVGVLSLISAIAFILIALIPQEFITDVGIPPVEGIFFDVFVILSFILMICKEITYVLGIVPKKKIIDKWFSLIILLLLWVNLITFGLGLVETSVFYDLGGTLQLIFIVFSGIDFTIAFIYFVRYRNPLFSSTFVISIMTIIYLQQWIIPVEPAIYTAIILIATILLILITLITKDLIPSIGTMILVPMMLLSPYILSNTSIIAISILLGSFPLIDVYLSNRARKESLNFNKGLSVLSNVSCLFGIITLGFMVFYGYLPEESYLILLSTLILVLLLLKMRFKQALLFPFRDWTLILILIFFTAFFDMISIDLIILTGIAGILTLFVSYNFFEYTSTKRPNIIQFSEFLLLTALVIISITKIEFIPKSSFFIFPLLSLLILLYRGTDFDHSSIRLFVFGFISLFILSFLLHPSYDWISIPIFSLIALEGTLCVTIFHEMGENESFHIDLSIVTILLEIDLLVLMLGTTTALEMIYPVIMLIIVMLLICGIQVWKPLKENFVWVNSTYLITFGLMTYWNEFEPILTLIIVFMTLIPLVLEKITFKKIDVPAQLERANQSHNFNIALTAVGLTLVILFEELNPVSHAILLLLGPIVWIVVSIRNKIDNSTNLLLIVISPGIIYLFELIIHTTIFTPVTEVIYLYSTLIVIATPAILLQSIKFFKKGSLTENRVNPFIMMTVIYSVLITYSTWIYELDVETVSLLYLVLLVIIVISSFLITWQYESTLLVITTFLPSVMFSYDVDFPQLVLYILPIIPLCFNIGIAFKRMKSVLAVKLHETLMVIYLIFFILMYPVKILEYTIFLATLLLISWQILGTLNRKLDSSLLEITSFLNTILVLTLAMFIDSYLPETILVEGNIILNLNTIFLVLSCLIIALSTILGIIYWQVKQESVKLPILLSGSLVANFLSLLLVIVSLLLRTTDFTLDEIALGFLIISSSLLFLGLLTNFRFTRLNSEIISSVVIATSLWVLITSTFFHNIEVIFLWILFAPILVAHYLHKKEFSYLSVGIVFYTLTSMRLLEIILDSLQTGITNWLGILGLVLLGVELLSIGIYTVLEN